MGQRAATVGLWHVVSSRLQQSRHRMCMQGRAWTSPGSSPSKHTTHSGLLAERPRGWAPGGWVMAVPCGWPIIAPGVRCFRLPCASRSGPASAGSRVGTGEAAGDVAASPPRRWSSGTGACPAVERVIAGDVFGMAPVGERRWRRRCVRVCGGGEGVRTAGGLVLRVAALPPFHTSRAGRLRVHGSRQPRNGRPHASRWF